MQNYDEFVDALFQFYWTFTEQSLSRVRQRLDEELKPKLIGAFDSLDADFVALLRGMGCAELEAAITNARTEMQTTLETVKGWFRLSKAAEKADFEVSTLLEIALRSTNNCFKYAQLTPTRSLQVDLRLRGDTLTHLVEVFYLLFSNIVLHSGVRDRSPSVSVEVCNAENGWLRFTIVNEVSFASDTERVDARNTIQSVTDFIAGSDLGSLLDRDRGTGYARIRKVLTYDLSCDHRIAFGLEADNRC